ncbi:MAG: hypothetical protein V7647_3368 [Acidobacteriota bacterium]|jgi:hypothetical protein
MTAVPLPFWSAYLLVALGIAISMVLPVLRALIPAPPPLVPALPAGPYLAVGAVSLLTAVLVLAFNDGQFSSPYTALLAGYAWDSTLQKVASR